jgi:hypothetical protein
LIWFYEDERLELYDIKKDLGENHDLATESPQKAAELKRLLDDWLEEIGAGMPASNPAFKEKEET